MPDLLEFIKFLLAIGAFIMWGVGHAVMFGLRLFDRRSERLTRFLSSTKEDFFVYWMAYAGLVLIVVAGIGLTMVFNRSPAIGWTLVGSLVAAGLAALWFLRRRISEVGIIILASIVGTADLIFVLAMWVERGALVGLGLLLAQAAIASCCLCNPIRGDRKTDCFGADVIATVARVRAEPRELLRSPPLGRSDCRA